MKEEAYRLSKRINAIGNKTRLAIMGLIYIEDKLTFDELFNESKLDKDTLAYHLTILIDAELIKRKKQKYQNTRYSKQIMKDLGFIKRIKKLEKNNERNR